MLTVGAALRQPPLQLAPTRICYHDEQPLVMLTVVLDFRDTQAFEAVLADRAFP
jgi:hypothetical protein